MNRSASDCPCVLYIAGYGRSGSTLLNGLLGQEPGVCGAGELANFADWAGSARPCSCGEPIASCRFWSEVRRRAGVTNCGRGGRQALVESPAALVFGYWWIPRSVRVEYREWHRHLFRSVGEVSGAAFVVDCSKSAYLHAGRARALRAIAGLDVRIVHLVRSPQAVRASLASGTNKELEGRSSGDRRLRRLRAFVGWSAANVAALWMTGWRDRGFSRLLRYEELVGDPQKALAELSDALKFPADRVFAVLRSEQGAENLHVAEGNRMRLQPLALQSAPVVTAGRIDRILCLLVCGPIARVLGYSYTGLPASAPVSQVG